MRRAGSRWTVLLQIPLQKQQNDLIAAPGAPREDVLGAC
jgi:hypothetical protein